MAVAFAWWTLLLVSCTLLVSICALKASPPVHVYKDLASLSFEVCNHLLHMCQSELDSKESFHLAIPGGSVLKMLAGVKEHPLVS